MRTIPSPTPAPRTPAAPCGSCSGSAGSSGAPRWSVLVMGVAWMVSHRAGPRGRRQGHRRGHRRRRPGGLVRWALVLLGLGAVARRRGRGAALLRRVRTGCTPPTAARSSPRAASTRAGPALTRTMPAGEVVAVFANDVMRLGGLYDVMARFAGAVVSYVVVGAILLAASPPLGLARARSAARCCSARLTFIVRPLQRRQAAQREEAGPADHARRRHRRRAARAARHRRRADLPAPLRGAVAAGARASASRWPASRPRSTPPRCCCPASSSSSSPGSAPASPSTGEITAGQLVAFYGYTAFLTIPLRTATEFVDRLIRAHIGARQGAAGPARSSPTTTPRRPGTAPLPPADGVDLARPAARGVRGRAAGLPDRARLGPPGGARGPRRPAGPARPRPARGHAGVAPARRPRRCATVRRAHRRQRDRPAPVHRRPARAAPGRSPRDSDDARSSTALAVASAARRARGAARRPRRRASRSAAGPSPAASASGSPWRGRCSPSPRSWCWSSRPAPSTPTPRPGSPGASPQHRARAHHGRHDRQPAAARPGRRGRAPRGRPRRRQRHPPRAAGQHPAYRRRRDPRGGATDIELITDHARRTLPVADMRRGARSTPAALVREHRGSLAPCSACTPSPRSPPSPRPGWSASSSTRSAATATSRRASTSHRAGRWPPRCVAADRR